MFVREKSARGHTYLYLVENERNGGRIRQRIIRALGRKDVLLASGELDRLAVSLVRHCDRAVILSDMEAGRIACTRIGGPLLFGRLWERLGIAEVLGELLASRGFEFAVERAVFASVLHRLFVSGSDRSCDKWMTDYRIEGTDGLQLHHLYRAMAWLGEEIAPAGALAPRCVKDLIEERLFEHRRDLFSDLSLVFMDTTSLSFYGAGGDSLGAYGHSKDHRADLKQMILAVVIDGDGRPICTEMLPGNTADATVLLPVVDRLRERFHIGRVCVVADRGMISAATIAALEERKLEYILGARERSSAVVRRLVLDDEAPLTPLLVERVRGETQLFVKEVKVGAARYVLCRNEAEAERERNERRAIIAGLAKQLARGDKALIGNSAYRRYLRRTPSASGKPGPAFEIDPGKLAEEARYDGLFVLRTNARITPLQETFHRRVVEASGTRQGRSGCRTCKADRHGAPAAPLGRARLSGFPGVASWTCRSVWDCINHAVAVIYILSMENISSMIKVSAAEFQRNIGKYQDAALTQPVVVARNGRERTVMISVEEYHRLKRRDRRVMGLGDFTDEDIAALEE